MKYVYKDPVRATLIRVESYGGEVLEYHVKESAQEVIEQVMCALSEE